MEDEKEREFIHDIVVDDNWVKFLNEDIEDRFVDVIFTMDDMSEQIFSCHMDTSKGFIDYLIDCVCAHNKQNFRKVEIIKVRGNRKSWEFNDQ